MRRTIRIGGFLLLPFAAGCGTDVNQALMLAAESGARTFLDVLISDVYSDLPELLSVPPGAGEPVEEGVEGGEAQPSGGTDGGGGDVEAGAATFSANSCSACHCDDASGGCLPAAPNIQGIDLATLQDRLQGDAPHTGGKFPELSEQDLAGLEAFLADLAAG